MGFSWKNDYKRAIIQDSILLYYNQNQREVKLCQEFPTEALSPIILINLKLNG